MKQSELDFWNSDEVRGVLTDFSEYLSIDSTDAGLEIFLLTQPLSDDCLMLLALDIRELRDLLREWLEGRGRVIVYHWRKESIIGYCVYDGKTPGHPVYPTYSAALIAAVKACLEDKQ